MTTAPIWFETLLWICLGAGSISIAVAVVMAMATCLHRMWEEWW